MRWLRPLPAILLFVGVYAVLFTPLLVVAGASFSKPDTGALITSFVEFPPREWSLEWYRRIPAEQFEALAISLALAVAAALGACLLGVPAAFGLVRGRFPGKGLVAALFRAPLQIPAVVSGIAFLQLYYLVETATGWVIHGSFLGLWLAHVFLATPFVVGAVGALLQRFNVRLEEAAAILGASPMRRFRRVTLPLILPGVYSGALYGFMVSFIDVPVSLFLSAAGRTPYPVELFYAMEHEFNPTILASATLTMVGALVILLLFQRLVGLDALIRSGK